MALLDGQYSYRGLVFGEGTDLLVNSAEGFEGFDMRTSDSDQPRGDGGIRGLDYVAPRTVALELVAWDEGDGDGSTYEATWAAVRAAFQPSRETDYPLVFKRPGQPERQIRCRPVQLVRNERWQTFGRSGYPPVVLRAVDPRIYSLTQYTENVQVYAAVGGGGDFAIEEFPLELAGGVQNELVAINSGDADAYPLIRFYGPSTGSCTRVTLTNSTNGDVIDVQTAITAGQILTADMDAVVTGANRLVIRIDTASRYGDWQLPRAPFRLSPGSNTIRLQAEGDTDGVLCNLTWHDTWIG